MSQDVASKDSYHDQQHYEMFSDIFTVIYF